MASYIADNLRDAFFKKLGAHVSCFDCEKEAGANWVSVTFGIVLCIDCAGQHRQKGTHVSFVRSGRMDKFKVEELLSMELGGNGRAREALGGSNPVDYEGVNAVAYREKLKSEVAEYIASGKMLPWDRTTETSQHDTTPMITKNTATRPAWAAIKK